MEYHKMKQYRHTLYVMIQSQQLRVLVAIRDGGSLTRAAHALGYGVPTIAHHLASLERHFQAQLVARNPQGAVLTPLGAVFVTEAEEILVRLDQAERLVVAQRDLGLATIRVGTFASIGSQLLPRAIRQLRSLMRVQVEVVEAEPTDVVAQLRTGDLHAGLIYDSAEEPAFASPDLALPVLVEEDYRVLVANKSGFATQSKIDLADLADADWICSRDENAASDRALRRACHLAGFEPNILMRTDDLNMIHGLVAEGLGCTLATQAAVDTRFAVITRPTVQGLGIRRTSFVYRPIAVPQAVNKLHQILVDLVPRQTAA